MKEDFLHYVWKYQLLEFKGLHSVQNERIQVLTPGLHNCDSGPDFHNAKIRIDDQVWVGTVEIHVNSSDWYWHQHEIDKKYDAVILHVVWDHDVDVYMKNNKPLPTLELKGLIPRNIRMNYDKLIKTKISWIPCEDQITQVEPLLLQNWLERLFIERLERKSLEILNLLNDSKNNWETVLFWLLAKNFGLNKNAGAFFQLARSIPFDILRKCLNDSLKLEALLFGQANLLTHELEEEYTLILKREYEFLKHKFDLEPISEGLFQFFRMRPSNFPTIRLAQLCALYTSKPSLFSNLIKLETIDELYRLFNIHMSEFWKQHYTFSKRSKQTSKKLTSSFIDLLLINTIIPLKFAYLRSKNGGVAWELMELISHIKPEKNSIITSFVKLGVKVNNAFDSQALLELKNNYCAFKRCLECAIGNKLLRS